MSITGFYLLLSGVLFTLGTLGVLLRRNTLIVFMCIELMLNSVNIALVAFSREFRNIDAQVYVFFVLAIAAAEAAVGLGIIISVFRNYYTVRSSDVYTLRG